MKGGISLNGVFLVGKLVQQPELRTTSTGLKLANLILDVNRNFRNQNGELEVERFSCTIWRAVAETVIDTCKAGDTIIVRGRLQANNYLAKDESQKFNVEIIAENVSIVR